MATIIKKKENSSKGIISFTHKEKKYFNNLITNLLLKKQIKEIKENYFFSMHWGWYHKDHKDIPLIDFHLAGKGTLNFKNTKSNLIMNFCNRNFIDKKFKVKNLNKIYDIISITRPVKFKNIDKIFSALRKIYNKKIYLKVLIIFPIYSKNDLNKKEYYTNLFEDYQKIFSPKERNYFSLMPVYSGSLFPLSKDDICNFLNQSKLFLLPVEKEGASRVIHEALLCGVPVITCKNLKGGGLDYLNEQNSCLIDDLDRMDETILMANEKIDKFVIEEKKIREQLSAEYQVDKFKDSLKNFYKSKNIKWIDNCEFENLDRKLDSHQITLNKKWVGLSNDLKNLLSFYFFLNFIQKKKNNYLIILIIIIYERIFSIIKRIKYFLS